MGSSEVTSTTAVVPTWVSCDRRQIQDFHKQAYLTAARTRAPRVIGMLAAIDWVVGCEPVAPITGQHGLVTSEQIALTEMNRAVEARRAENSATGWAGGVADALAYFVGLLSSPPLEVPRRNPDGTVVTAEQLYQEFLDSHSRPTPEQRDKAHHDAQVTAIRWERLASATP